MTYRRINYAEPSPNSASQVSGQADQIKSTVSHNWLTDVKSIVWIVVGIGIIVIIGVSLADSIQRKDED
ncbi:MAG: hypothetical protein HN757_17050 [Calditrichaeota bacterium]|jgi:hypothetical protein|nr:hypothetical protein [Calditrichota bacterium]